MTVSYWRGLTQADGLLAQAYLRMSALHPALAAVNEAIAANENIPDELYFVPKNLAIKAEILARLGQTKASNDLYEKSMDLLDSLLSKAPTPTVERQLLADLSVVYAGYFASLSNSGRIADAFHVIERARGRVEAESLAHHDVIVPHEPNAAEQQLTKLNVELLNSDDSAARGHLLNAIYAVEQELPATSSAGRAPQPVPLLQLQHELGATELFVEYVLSEPQSYALAVTRNSARRYTLPQKAILEQRAVQYRSELMQRKTDSALAQKLFNGLLGVIPEFKEKYALIVVPDGKLHLLPFAALMNDGQYILTSHRISVVPSGIRDRRIYNEALINALAGNGHRDLRR